jgi:hypothetical protein
VALQSISTGELLDGLVLNTEPERRERMTEVCFRWARQLETRVSCSIGEIELRGNFAAFTVEPQSIRLRDMDELRCLLIAGDGENPIPLGQETMKWACMPGRLSLVLTVTMCALQKARTLFPASEFLVLAPHEVRSVLLAGDSPAAFKRILRERIPKRTLMPFNYQLPASPNMFCGRGNALKMLTEQRMDSFAIVGPGRVGKTSLIKHYEKHLVWKKDPRVQCKHYIDFFDCDDKSDDGIARFIAMKISAANSSTHIKARGAYNPKGTPQRSLFTFFTQLKHEEGRPLELLLDEVDEVCLSEAFAALGEAAKLGLIRMVICGRGILFEAMSRNGSPLANRLELLQLEPLSRTEADELVTKPLEDLGFRIKCPERFTGEVFRHAMGLPHAIQFLGHEIVEWALQEGTDSVSADTVREVTSKHRFVQMQIRPFLGLRGAMKKLATALAKSESQHFTVGEVRDIAESNQIGVTDESAVTLCNGLVIEGFLVWAEGRYALSSQELPDSLLKLGLLI